MARWEESTRVCGVFAFLLLAFAEAAFGPTAGPAFSGRRINECQCRGEEDGRSQEPGTTVPVDAGEWAPDSKRLSHDWAADGQVPYQSQR